VAALGAEIRSTSYFVVDSPDIVGNNSGNVGIPPFGQTGGTYISNVKEYADYVVINSTDVPDTVTGDFLQQAATNQVILRFDLRTGLSRAALSSLTLSRLRTIIPKPQTLEINKTYYFSNENG